MNTFYRRSGALSIAAVSFFLLCGDTAPQSCNSANSNFGSIGPSKGEVVGAAVAVGAVVVGTVVLVHVHNEHHRLKGCVTNGPKGLQVTTPDGKKTWDLDGDVTKVRPGDLVQLHGSRIKRTADGQSEETFKVEKLKKDLGPCSAKP